MKRMVSMRMKKGYDMYEAGAIVLGGKEKA